MRAYQRPAPSFSNTAPRPNQQDIVQPIMSSEAVVYITETPSTAQINNNQRQLLQLLDAYKIAYVVVDCADPANKDARNAAWEISKKRAVYPQLVSHPPQQAKRAKVLFFSRTLP